MAINMKLHLICLFCIIYSLSVLAGSAIAENSDQSEKLKLNTSMQELLEIEEKSITRLDIQIAEEEAFSKNILLEFSSFRLQFSTRANLILMSETPVKNLEKANEEHVIALAKIRARIQEINQRAKEVETLIATTAEQVNINEKQLNSLKIESKNSPEVKTLISGYISLNKKMLHKQKLLINLRDIYRSVSVNIVKVEQDFALLSEKFENEIRTRKRKHLFQRNTISIESSGKTIAEDTKKLLFQFLPVFSASFWFKEIKFLKTVGSLNIIVFFVLYSIVLITFIRLKNQLIIWKEKEILKTFWIQVSINTLEKTLFLLSIVIYLFIFSQSGILYSRNPLVLMMLNLCSVWLFSKWFLIVIDHWVVDIEHRISSTMTFRIRFLIYFSRLFAMVCIIGDWLYSDTNIIFIVARVLFLLTLFFWCILFWERLFTGIKELSDEQETRNIPILSITQYLIYAVIILGIIADLTGYGTFAFYWLTSWARSSVVILWCFLFFFSAGELSIAKKVLETQPVEEETGKSISLHWFVSRIGLVLLLIIMFIAIVYAWGGKQAVLINIYSVLAKPVSIGSWEVSFLHIVFSVIALFITNAIAVTWRQFFQEVILKESGIDIGIQDSVSTLSYYVIWFIGILLSLNLFGISMKSVTLIFGALGIGLGFGLQNIFNNFISGIILLFERPIQVGDDLEIDGVWATVKKINVRSTVVQTYDNATLIIPNSEFVSAKVVNWSFKDKRIRRVIEVGVAYGSDIELVKKTLLDAAHTTPRILKIPKPDIHFTSFGDSALIFKLRIWTKVDYFMAVETETRFKIDQLFRENNIEISFPQRDLHIRSVNKKEVSSLISSETE